MRFLLVLLIAAIAFAEIPADDAPLITKAFTEYLKKVVDWEVVDYEENIFRGWTFGEARAWLQK